MSDRWASFDCYGTLIDWMSGIRATLADLFPGADPDRLLAGYHRIEPRVQAGTFIPYRSVMAEALAALAEEEGLEVPEGREDALGASLPSWPVFSEASEALRGARDAGFKLAVLSNTDRQLLDASISALGIGFDEIVVAADAGSYKPALGHWETFFRRTGATKEAHAHVAASLFHDVEPCAALGLACVWINRLGETSRIPRAATLTDLATLPPVLDTLVSPELARG